MPIDNSVVNKNNAYKYDSVNIDEEFKKEIILGIPRELNKLETAMYIYLKLCQTLTYDEDYFQYSMGTNTKRTMPDMSHTKPSDLFKINSNNNSVVCWEFITIYGKILKDFGIDSYVYDIMLSDSFDDKPTRIVNENNFFKEQYGTNHVRFGIKIDNSFIDVYVSALYGDFCLAKNNSMIRNVECVNSSFEERYALANAIKKAYSILCPNQTIEKCDFKEYSEESEKYDDGENAILLDKKIKLLFERVQQSDLTKMDMIDYILILRKMLFDRKERRDNFKAIIISGDCFNCEVYKPTMIFALNDKSFLYNPEETYYYVYNQKNIMPISKEELESRFLDGHFMYFYKGAKIPGIESKSAKRLILSR